MKRIVIAMLVVMLAAWFGLAQFTPAASATAVDNATQTRLLTGTVTDRSNAPLQKAIVYLKNTKTLAVKTYFTDAQGQYRFPALSPNVDYEIYAEFNGRKSDTKTLSSFDSRAHAVINVKVDTGR